MILHMFEVYTDAPGRVAENETGGAPPRLPFRCQETEIGLFPQGRRGRSLHLLRGIITILSFPILRGSIRRRNENTANSTSPAPPKPFIETLTLM